MGLGPCAQLLFSFRVATIHLACRNRSLLAAQFPLPPSCCIVSIDLLVKTIKTSFIAITPDVKVIAKDA